MTLIRALLFLTLGLASPVAVSADDDGKGFPSGASYEACSMIASQYLTTLQLLQQGFDPEILKETLPGLTERGAQRIDALKRQIERSGLNETYSGVNARYARCATKVHEIHGQPKPGTRQQHFYVCAGENKIRYEILLAAWAGGSLEQIRPQLAKPHRAVADRLFKRLEETDISTVFSDMASELKQCLNRAPGNG